MYLRDAHEAAYFGPCSEIAGTLSGVSDEGAVVGKLVFGPDYLRGDWAWAYLLAASQDLAEVFTLCSSAVVCGLFSAIHWITSSLASSHRLESSCSSSGSCALTMLC